MSNRILYLLVCLFYLSCKKETVEEYVVVPAQPATPQIKIDKVVNDSTLVLKWSKYTGENFLKYRLVRTAKYMKNGQFGTYAEPIDSSTDINHLSFTDDKMPLAREVYYEIFFIKNNVPQYPWMVSNARVNYQRPNSLVYGNPTDVLFNKQDQKLYITEQNKIWLVDYNGRINKSVEFPVNIGYCSLGDFNGARELYVPQHDGWLYIYDASLLQFKDKIYVGGYEIGSVVAANEKLYVSSTEKSSFGYSNCIKIYDRASKYLISRTGYWENTRLTLLEGTNVEMIDLTINLMPIDLHYYQFSSTGYLVNKKEDKYHGDYAMSHSIVRSFPDGNRFITSGAGTIFSKSLVFDRYINQWGGFSDFAFNANGSVIYASYAAQKKIDVVSYPATTTISSFTTKLFPYKIFRDDNTLICVGRPENTSQMSYLLIEKINL